MPARRRSLSTTASRAVQSGNVTFMAALGFSRAWKCGRAAAVERPEAAEEEEEGAADAVEVVEAEEEGRDAAAWSSALDDGVVGSPASLEGCCCVCGAAEEAVSLSMCWRCCGIFCWPGVPFRWIGGESFRSCLGAFLPASRARAARYCVLPSAWRREGCVVFGFEDGDIVSG